MLLKDKALQGVKWDSLATGIIAGGSLLQIFLLVRFIDKSDFGQMAMINVVIAFAIVFLDFGVSSGIIHKQKIADEELSTLYWLSIIIGAFFSILFYFSSEIIAGFYAEPELDYLIKVVSSLFFIQSFGVQYRVLLTKKLQFKLLSKINLWIFLCSFLTTITLAIFHFGVMSLIVGRLTKAILESLLLMRFGRNCFNLSIRINTTEISYFIWFGSFQMGERFLNFFNRQVDLILIGKFLGSEALGVYDVIKRLLSRPYQLVNPIINKISFPVLSIIQNDDIKVKNYYLKQLNYICTLNFSIYLFLFFNASLILALILGPEWVAYQDLFMLMALYFLIYSSGNPVGTLLLSRGMPALGFYWNLVTMIMISSFVYLGSHYGLQGIATALLMAQCILFIPNYVFLVNKAVKIPYQAYFGALGVPFMLAIIVGSISYFVSQFLLFSPFLNLFILTILALIAFILFTMRFNRDFVNDFKLLFRQ